MHYFSCNQVTALAHGPLRAALSREFQIYPLNANGTQNQIIKFVKYMGISAIMHSCNSLTYNEK